MAPAPFFPESASALRYLIIASYPPVVSTTIYIYDYLLTLPDEVSLIWPSPWTPMKLLFLLTRYIPFVDAGLMLYFYYQSHRTTTSCYLAYKAVAWLFYIGKGLPEVILTLRTWAVWNRDRRLAIFLPIFFFICWAPLIGVLVIFLNSVELGVLTSPVSLGCVVTKASHIVGIAWISMVTYQSVIFLLMVLRAIQYYRQGGSSRLFQVVFRDGLRYYIYLFAVSLTTIIVVATAPPALITFLISTERVVQAIIGCRVILDIRQQTTDRTQWANKPLSPPPMILARSPPSTGGSTDAQTLCTQVTAEASV